MSLTLPKLQWRIASLKNGFQEASAYRIEFFIEMVSSAFVPAAIQWVIWYALFILGNQKLIGGFTYPEMLSYTFMSLLFTQIRGGDLDFELAEMVREGSLSNYLLKPVGVIEFTFLRGSAPKIFITGLCLSAGLIASFYFEGLSGARMLGAMGLAVLGNIIHYQIGALISALAFYWEEAYSVLMVKNMIVSLLSGELLPLNLFPESVTWVWKSTPFYLYVFGPTQYALGRWSENEFLSACGIAALWILGLSLLIHFVWKLSIKRYLSLGG